MTEGKYLFIIVLGLLIFIFDSLLVYLIFGVRYFVFLLIVFFSIVIFLFFLFYLRIQHNIERRGEKIYTKITDFYDEIVIRLKELKSYTNSKFEEQEQIYEEILDFLEKLTINKIKKK